MTLNSRLQVTVTLICHENYLFFYYILARTCNAFAFQFVIKYYELSGMLVDSRFNEFNISDPGVTFLAFEQNILADCCLLNYHT